MEKINSVEIREAWSLFEVDLNINATAKQLRLPKRRIQIIHNWYCSNIIRDKLEQYSQAEAGEQEKK